MNLCFVFALSFRRGMGLIQYRHILVYSMCFRASQYRCTHIKSEALEDGSMGGQRNWTHERGWQLQGSTKIWTTCARLLQKTHGKHTTVSLILVWIFFSCFVCCFPLRIVFMTNWPSIRNDLFTFLIGHLTYKFSVLMHFFRSSKNRAENRKEWNGLPLIDGFPD